MYLIDMYNYYASIRIKSRGMQKSNHECDRLPGQTKAVDSPGYPGKLRRQMRAGTALGTGCLRYQAVRQFTWIGKRPTPITSSPPKHLKLPEMVSHFP